jgi:hypothetical protein
VLARGKTLERGAGERVRNAGARFYTQEGSDLSRTPSGEPSSDTRFPPNVVPLPPPRWHMGPHPWRHLRAAPRWRAKLGRLPARPRAPALGWAKIPPARLTRNSLSFPFPFFLSPFFLNIPFYVDNLCTKNGPNTF